MASLLAAECILQVPAGVLRSKGPEAKGLQSCGAWQAVSMASAGQQLAVPSQWLNGVPHDPAVAECGIGVAPLLAALAAVPSGVKAVHGSGAQLHSQVCE